MAKSLCKAGKLVVKFVITFPCLLNRSVSNKFKSTALLQLFSNVFDIKKNALRRTITTVLQDTVLFSTTILENIRYGKLDATDEEVYAAAKIANVDKIIENLPDGYNTKISATDVSLSQGQIQLISIARAVLANSKIIILDLSLIHISEPTRPY